MTAQIKTKTNHLAVWVAIILGEAIGILWYSPPLFLNPWLAAQGRTMAQLEAGPPWPPLWAFVTSALTAYTIAWLIQHMDVRGFMAGAKLGVILFFGFVLFALAAHYQFLGVANQVMWIDLGQVFIWMILTAGIIAGWRKPSGGS